MVKPYYIYRYSVCYIYGQNLLYLWLKVVTMLVNFLLIYGDMTFMVFIYGMTFMVFLHLQAADCSPVERTLPITREICFLNTTIPFYSEDKIYID